MTFWAKKLEDSGGIEVNVTHGPVRVAVIEDPGHLRHFWGELGRLLEETEAARPGAEVLGAGEPGYFPEVAPGYQTASLLDVDGNQIELAP